MGHFWAKNQHFLIFLKICSLLFSDFLHEVKVQYTLENDGTLFLREILTSPKMGQKGHFWAQNQHFLTFLKICSLLFSDFLQEVKVQ